MVFYMSPHMMPFRATIEQLDSNGKVYRTFIRYGYAAEWLRSSIEQAYNMKATRLTIEHV
jgi:hypothetical protein